MIEFVRGDTFLFKFKIKLSNEKNITKEEIENLFITARKNTTISSPILFQKTLNDVDIDENGYCHAKINPKDTEQLSYGLYFFDIEITLKNGYRKTKLFKFNLTEETSIHESGD